MALLTKTGSFATGTGTSDIVITGLGFVPKFIFFWDSRQTSATDAVTSLSNERSMGFATGTADRRAVGQRGGSLVQKMITRDDACIATAVTAGTVDGLLDIKSIDADGFTIAVDDNFGASHIIGYWAVGGDDITATSIGTFVEPASTGDQDITTPGFQPDAVFLLGSTLGTPPTTGANCTPMFGVAVATASTPDNAVWAGFGKDGVATTVLKSYCRTGECVAMWDTSGNTDGRASITSMLSNGFRVNWTERATTTRNLFYLAVKGGSYKVNSVTTLTNTTGDISSGALGFAPKGGLVVSAQQTSASSADTPQADDRWSFGAFSANASIDQRVLATSDEDNVGTGVVSNGVHYADVYLNINRASAGTLDGSMAVHAINPNSFDFRMTDADPSGVFAWFVAIGRVETSTFRAPQYPGLRGIGPPTEWARMGLPIFPSSTVATATTDVTLALTGSSVTASPGALASDLSVALPGSSATASPGTLAPAVAQALAGSGAAASPGSVAPAVAPPLVGTAATASPGSMVPAIDASLAGSQASVAAGSPSAGLTQTLAGAAAAASPGTLSSALDAALAGASATAAPGSVAPTVGLALAGQQVVASVGSMAAPGQTPLSGQQVQSQAGQLKPGVAQALAGAGSVVGQGDVGASVTIALTGQSIAVGQGILTSTSGDVTIALVGIQMTIVPGTLRHVRQDPVWHLGQAGSSATPDVPSRSDAGVASSPTSVTNDG